MVGLAFRRGDSGIGIAAGKGTISESYATTDEGRRCWIDEHTTRGMVEILHDSLLYTSPIFTLLIQLQMPSLNHNSTMTLIQPIQAPKLDRANFLIAYTKKVSYKLKWLEIRLCLLIGSLFPGQSTRQKAHKSQSLIGGSRPIISETLPFSWSGSRVHTAIILYQTMHSP